MTDRPQHIEAVLREVRAAIAQYRQDLADRKHGGVAMIGAFHKIADAIDSLAAERSCK